jgi:hypothetical protein
MKKIIFLLSILFIFAACGEKAGQADVVQEEFLYSDAVAAKRMMGSGADFLQPDSEQKIIRSASLTYEVQTLETSLETLSSRISEYKGYVQHENQYQRGNRIYYNLNIRIPAESFDTFIDEILQGKDIRRLEEKNISARDVTEQFIDIEVRLATQRQALKRYRELLQKAETVSDMIAVEEHIRRLQSEIESQEARLEYLSRQVDMSEVRISMYETTSQAYVGEKPDAFAARLLHALHKGWNGLVAVFFWIIRLWPLWLLTVLIRIILKIRSRKG